MKTKTLLLLFLLISGMVSAQVKRVAVLETVDKENKVSYANKLVLRTSLSKAIANTPGYEVYDRTDVDAIMSEHTFQRTGLVNSDQIKRLGEMTGAEYILVAEAVKINAKNLLVSSFKFEIRNFKFSKMLKTLEMVGNIPTNIFVTAKLLDVETARTIVTEMLEINTDHMQQGCMILAKKMFSDKRELDFGTAPVGPQLLINSKSNQRLLGLKKYSYGDSQMDEQAFRNFLRNNSPEIYIKYMKSQSYIKAGWGIFGAGATVSVAGLLLAILEGQDELPFDFYNDDLAYLCIASAGAAITLTSIPILCVGHKRQKNAINMFNEQNSRQQAPITLNLQANQNGVGLALNF